MLVHVTTSKGGPSPSPQTTNTLTNRHKFGMAALQQSDYWPRTIPKMAAALSQADLPAQTVGRVGRALLTCWLAAIAVLVWLAIPQASSFDKRWPVALPPAMSLQMFNAARKASERPAFCMYNHIGSACRIGYSRRSALRLPHQVWQTTISTTKPMTINS
jgi:hypothetical protein